METPFAEAITQRPEIGSWPTVDRLDPLERQGHTLADADAEGHERPLPAPLFQRMHGR